MITDGKRSSKLRDALENEIATGALKAGARLDEVQLATRFGVSRTPVREALHQLASSGYIEIRPRRGAVVASVGPGRLVEMFEVMAELEGMCARLAARRLTDVNRRALSDSLEACHAAAVVHDADRYYEANQRFHYALYRAGRNGFLEEEARRLHVRLKPYRRLQLRVRGRVGTSYSEHEGIVAAIFAGDARVAEQRARAHVLVQGERFADLMATLGEVAAMGEQ